MPAGVTPLVTRLHPSFDFHRFHNRATSDPSYLGPFSFTDAIILPWDNELYLGGGGGQKGTHRQKTEESMMETGEALSSAESAAKNNVHVEFYSTDSSHFYVCLISLPYPPSLALLLLTFPAE